MQDKFDTELSEAINQELESIREAKENISSDKTDLEVPIYASNEHGDRADYERDVERIIREKFPDVELNPYRVRLVADKLLDCSNRCLAEQETTAELIKFFAEMEGPSEESGKVKFHADNEPYDPDEEDPDYEDEGPDFEDIMDEYRGRIEVIPNSDYRNLPPTFEFVTYHYFEEDDVLIDDGDMVIDDIEGTVGDALVHFDEEENDGDTVYLINGDYGLAIEIVRFHSSYENWSDWGR